MSEPAADNAPLILAVETATRSGSVALARGPELISVRDGDPATSHSANLIEMVDAVLKAGDTDLTKVDLFAAAVGPGSFTGLRIGLATVKAFAVSMRRQVAAVPTLAALACATRAQGTIVSLLPAGRGEVFVQSFAVTDSDVTPLEEPAHVRPEELAQRYDRAQRITWAGAGLQAGIRLPERLQNVNRPLAPAVAILAARDYGKGNVLEPEGLHAVYVRPSDAEINERWQQQKAQLLTQS